MSEIIKIKNLIKKYKLYDKPADRFKEAIHPFKKSYHKEFVALNGINLLVEKGDAIGILGKNGSGKSTLLKLITGVLTPSSGDLEINGRISAILELGAGFNPEYTGRENIYLNGLMMGYSRERMDEKVDSVIAFADIGTFIDQPVKIYSSGMFARLAFAVSINVEPDILIVDEALAVGDTRFQTKCIDKMKELKKNGTTILFVSHASEQVKRFCNKAVWIKNGRVEEQGDSSEIVDLYEDYMRNDSEQLIESNTQRIIKEGSFIEQDFILPSNPDVLALITNVQINKTSFRTFEELIVEIEYEVYEESIEDLLLGVAIYTPSRDYIFGPNTFLEKISIPNYMGRHKVNYCIPQIPLLGGTFCLDVGLFNNEGIVNIHYKENALTFSITNKYFSEGLVYIKHNWEVLK